MVRKSKEAPKPEKKIGSSCHQKKRAQKSKPRQVILPLETKLYAPANREKHTPTTKAQTTTPKIITPIKSRRFCFRRKKLCSIRQRKPAISVICFKIPTGCAMSATRALRSALVPRHSGQRWTGKSAPALSCCLLHRRC